MTRKQKQILWTWFWRIAILVIACLLVAIAGNQQSIMVNQEEIEIQNTDILDKLNEISVVVDPEEVDAYEYIFPKDEPISLGTFTVTHYCSCPICCGKSDGITATGTVATEGRTIAVDPNVIPLGSDVLIDGQVYIAEDVGGAIKGKKVDIYVSGHQEAVNRGKVTREVFVQ